ncbi:MAG TPA: hypothetical protein VJ767_07435 [Nitrososphaeraceae archaeon]|nr:hypothetical protein [Nitrososphaeraceae archaeon]
MDDRETATANHLPRIYEYEENIEVLITNSKSEGKNMNIEN